MRTPIARLNEDTHRIAGLLLALLATAGVGAEPIALVAGRIIDGQDGHALAHTTIVVDGERMRSPTGLLVPPESTKATP